MIIKYSEDIEMEWTSYIQGDGYSNDIYCITETHDETGKPNGFVVGGYCQSDTIKLNNGEILKSNR